ncbi:MAG: uroporphyrinogen-III synthase [Actinobacteria bacterium]|nr:uroporphyrinogen-III synthase [Actinomycetota bacterium]
MSQPGGSPGHGQPPSPGQPPNPGQLAGFSIVLTSDRRADELAGSFERRGAAVLRAPLLRIVPLVEDAVLHRVTVRVIAEPPDDVVVTTAIGFRGWVEAADAAGLAPDLLRVLARARLLVRGPKGRGAVRAAGLVESWSAPSETTVEAVDHLLAEGVAGRRVAVQLHGATDPDLLDRLRAAGAEVVEVPVYRWGPAPDPAAVQRAIEATSARAVDAVVFTSAPGSAAFLRAAEAAGRGAEVLAALRDDVVPAAVGPVTAGPLREAGLEPVVPDRYRLGALVRAVADHLVATRVRTVPTAGGALELRGQSASLDGRPLTLSPAPMAMLRALARLPGQIVARETLLAALPAAGDPHAVEVAVGRLRSGIGVPGVVRTVVKRGYCLDVPAGPPDGG